MWDDLAREYFVFALGVAKVLLWILTASIQLFLAGLVWELFWWVVWKVFGYRFTVKWSPMYADQNIVNWQWKSDGKGGVTIHDKEDTHRYPRKILQKGFSFMPWAFRIQWTKTKEVEKARGKLYDSIEERDKAIEAERITVEHTDNDSSGNGHSEGAKVSGETADGGNTSFDVGVTRAKRRKARKREGITGTIGGAPRRA